MANGTVFITPYTKKWIGGIMGTLLTVFIIAMFSNIENFHTHEDSSKKLVVVMQEELKEFKERSFEERVKISSFEGKLENYEDSILRLTAAVQSMERKMEALILDYSRFKDDLTKTLIEVIRAQ